MYRKAELTPAQDRAMEIARVTFMNKCPFLSYYFYECCIEYPTRDVEGAQTDGRRIYYNPDFMMGLKPDERLFVLAHELFHCVMRHPSRMKYYGTTGFVHCPTSCAVGTSALHVRIDANTRRREVIERESKAMGKRGRSREARRGARLGNPRARGRKRLPRAGSSPLR